MNCMNGNCKKQMSEKNRTYVGRNAISNNEVWRVFYECPDGHKYNEKVEIEGTANSAAR